MPPNRIRDEYCYSVMRLLEEFEERYSKDGQEYQRGHRYGCLRPDQLSSQNGMGESNQKPIELQGLFSVKGVMRDKNDGMDESLQHGHETE